MTTTGRYSPESLSLVLDEINRIRDLQSRRIANLHGRAGVLVGSSGIAAGLVSAAAEDGLWLLPIGAFAVSALFAVLTMAPRSGHVVQPHAVLAQAAGQYSRDVRAAIVAGIISEYQTQERRLRWPGITLRLSTWTFLLAIFLVLLVTASSAPRP